MTDQQNSPIIPEDVTESVRETMQGYGNAYQIWWSENPGTVYTLRTPDGTLQFGSLEEARAAGLAYCAVRTASLLEAHSDPRGLYQGYFDLDAADAAMKASHDGQPLQETFAAYKAGPLEADALLKWYAWQTSVAAPHPRAKAAEAVPEGIETAPRDGSMLRLLVKFDHANQDCNPLEDSAEPSWTIGFNTLKDTGEDYWHIAGWSWEQDCFCETLGEPIAWMPWPTPAAPQPLSTGVLNDE